MNCKQDNTNVLDNYSYDELSRLTNTTTSDPIFRQDDKNNSQISTLYNYDNVGNRDSVEQTTTWETKKGKEKEKIKIADYTNNNLNQYTSVIVSKAKQSTFKYDNNGNLTDDGKQIYIYDYRNRLVKVTNKDGEIKAEFSYDVLGRRTSKTTYNDDDEIKKIIKYTYSTQDIIQENTYGIRDGKEKLKNSKEYVYGKGIDDVIVIILTPSLSSSGAKGNEVEKSNKNSKQSIYFYQKDQLGSIMAITDKDGKTVKEYRYDVFGKAYEKKDRNENWKEYNRGDIDNTRLFTGREYDKEIGLYYYRARYYSADLGRFISRDPIGQVDDINLYSYVGDSPVMFVDTMGKAKEIMKGIFQKAVNDFGQYKDLNAFDKGVMWTNLNMGDYDFANDTTFQDMLSKKGYYNSDTKNVLLDGNRYNLGEVSNTLVGFNAYNMNYWEGTLKTGAMGYTLLAEVTNPANSNGIVGEYVDQELYRAGYSLGESLDNGGKLTTNTMMNTIKIGTDARYNLTQNYRASDILKVGALEGINNFDQIAKAFLFMPFIGGKK